MGFKSFNVIKLSNNMRLCPQALSTLQKPWWMQGICGWNHGKAVFNKRGMGCSTKMVILQLFTGIYYSGIYNKLILNMKHYEAMNGYCYRGIFHNLSILLMITCKVRLSLVLLSVSGFFSCFFTIICYHYSHILSISELMPICKNHQTWGFEQQMSGENGDTMG